MFMAQLERRRVIGVGYAASPNCHLLSRISRVEADVDQLINSTRNALPASAAGDMAYLGKATGSPDDDRRMQSGDVSRDDRNDPVAYELHHEQINKARLSLSYHGGIDSGIWRSDSSAQTCRYARQPDIKALIELLRRCSETRLKQFADSRKCDRECCKRANLLGLCHASWPTFKRKVKSHEHSP